MARPTWLSPLKQRSEKRRASERLSSLVEEVRKRDAEQNAASAPSETETVRLHAVWVAESYPAGSLESLLASLRRWASGRSEFTSQTARSAAWFDEALRTGQTGSTWLDPFVPKGSQYFALSNPTEVDLPQGVDYARAVLHVFVPSHAVLVMGFALDDAAGRRVEDALRASYQTSATRRNGSTHFDRPFDQKTRAVRQARQEQLVALAGFFRREAPGLFCRDVGDDTPPAVEFWMTTEARPFDDDRRLASEKSAYSFVNALDWRPWFDTWRTDDGLTLRPVGAAGTWRGHARSLELIVREQEFQAGNDLQPSGGRTREGYVGHLDESVNGLLGAWTLTQTIRRYESNLISLRQRLLQARHKPFRERVGVIYDVQNQLLAQRTDLGSLVRGIERAHGSLLGRFRFFGLDAKRWLPRRLRGSRDDVGAPARRSLLGRTWQRVLRTPGLRDRPDQPQRSQLDTHTWLEEQVLEMSQRAQHLVVDSQDLSDVALAMAETTGTQASLRLTRWITILTFLLAILGVATLILAGFALADS